MILKDVGRDVEELGSEVAETGVVEVFLCFLVLAGGVGARSFPFALDESLCASEGSGREFTLAGENLFPKELGDPALTRAFFLRLGFAA